MLPITILIITALGVLAPSAYASAPTFNIPVLNLPVTITRQPGNIPHSLAASCLLASYGRLLYKMNESLTPSKICAQLAFIHAVGLITTLSHELGHALVAKYHSTGPQDIEVFIAPHCLLSGIYGGKMNYTSSTPLLYYDTVKEMRRFLLESKSIEQKKIAMYLAGPLLGTAATGIIGYAFKDYIPIAPLIGMLHTANNLLQLVPLCFLSGDHPDRNRLNYTDGDLILKSYQKIRYLQQAELEITSLSPECKIPEKSKTCYQKMLFN